MPTALRDFLKFNIDHTTIYYPEQTKQLCDDIKANIKLKWYKKRNGGQVLNLPNSFDIETSSFYERDEKRACMYIWQMSICGLIIIGRTWSEFVETLETLAREFGLEVGKKHLVIYVQSLSYEFQFMRKWLEWVEVFAIDNRKPVHATTANGIEFKCSYVLSAFSLAKMGEHLVEIPVQKTAGLEYYERRHSQSTINWTQLRYCVNDVQVVVSFIFEEMLKNGNITKIPLTNTGYVRAFCRRACLQGFDNNPYKRKFQRYNYLNFIHSLTLTVDEYNQARRAFAGGFTHTNPFYADSKEPLYCFQSEDFTSAYPGEAVLSNEFPMSSCEVIDNITPEIFKESCELYFCMFDVVFEDLQATFLFDNYISYSRCWQKEGCTVANGRVVSGSLVGTTITNIDFDIIKRVYKWGKMKIARLRRYKRGYLPTELVKAILSLYADKTTLKDVKEKVIEYMQKKGMCNATFGMMCQAVFKDNEVYNAELDEWATEEADSDAEIEKYNTSKNRFLYYLWGLVITASCRRNLWSAILECKEDYIYADTDSIKYFNPEKHADYFNSYNAWIIRRIEKSSRFHRIPIDWYMPKTIKGEVKIISQWDFDGAYMMGKFLGAKRYLMTKWDGTTILTVSGLNKKITLPYMVDQYGPNIYDYFTSNLYIPKGKTGKLIHTYIDEETSGTLIDFEGVPGDYCERSSVHLEEGDYSLSISEEYKDYILDLQEAEDAD